MLHQVGPAPYRYGTTNHTGFTPELYTGKLRVAFVETGTNRANAAIRGLDPRKSCQLFWMAQ